MAFLGIDQSLNATGLCLIGEGGDVRTVTTADPGDRRDGERLAHIRSVVDGMLLLVIYGGSRRATPTPPWAGCSSWEKSAA